MRLTCFVQMSLAFAGAMASKATLLRLSPRLLPQAAPLSLAAPAPRAMVQRTLQRKPVALATAMAASYTAGRTPMVSAGRPSLLKVVSVSKGVLALCSRLTAMRGHEQNNRVSEHLIASLYIKAHAQETDACPQVQEVGSGVHSIAVNLIASTAFIGQSAARGLASGAIQVPMLAALLQCMHSSPLCCAFIIWSL